MSNGNNSKFDYADASIGVLSPPPERSVADRRMQAMFGPRVRENFLSVAFGPRTEKDMLMQQIYNPFVTDANEIEVNYVGRSGVGWNLYTDRRVEGYITKPMSYQKMGVNRGVEDGGIQNMGIDQAGIAPLGSSVFNHAREGYAGPFAQVMNNPYNPLSQYASYVPLR
jgi:hypothetical protein